MRPLVRDRLLARAAVIVPVVFGTLLWSATSLGGDFPGMPELAAATLGFGAILALFLFWPPLRFKEGSLIVPASLLGSVRPRLRLTVGQICSVQIEPPRGRGDAHARFPLDVFLEIETEWGSLRGHVPGGEEANALLIGCLSAARNREDLPMALRVAKGPRERL